MDHSCLKFKTEDDDSERSQNNQLSKTKYHRRENVQIESQKKTCKSVNEGTYLRDAPT